MGDEKISQLGVDLPFFKNKFAKTNSLSKLLFW